MIITLAPRGLEVDIAYFVLEIFRKDMGIQPDDLDRSLSFMMWTQCAFISAAKKG